MSVFCVFTFSNALAQSVVTDGTTNTGVTVNGSGAIEVDLAPANSNSTSINRYEEFSVGLPGVNLNNSNVRARTVVNEVTSSSPTNIEGALSVIGPEADVIIANPNGISINGGSFVNTGNVGIVTGPIIIDGQGRATSNVRGGSITIGPNGLSGAISELDLIAKRIEINGNISGNNGAEITSLNINAGDSDVIFDPDRILPDIFPWAEVTGANGTNQNAISVDITRRSSLASGSIRIAVTDAGAGVRMVGNAASSTGDFRISTDGKLELIGSQITSQRAVDIKASEVSLSSDDRQVSLLSRDTGIVIESTAGDLDLGDSSLEGQTVSSSNLASSGGITLISKASIKQSDLTSQFEASLNSNVDGVTLIAQDAIQLDGVSLESNDDLSLSAAGKISFKQVSADTETSIRLLSDGALDISSSQLDAENNITVAAASASFGIDNSAISNTRTEVTTTSGGILIETAQGDIINEGSLISGDNILNGEANADGAVTLLSARDVINRSIDIDHLGVLFGDSSDLSIQTSGDLINDHGRLFSNADVRLSVAHDFVNQTRLDGSSTDIQISNDTGSRLAETLWLKRASSTSVLGDFGELEIDNELGLVLAINDVSINAENIFNSGGDISGTDLNLVSRGNFTNSALRAGSVNFTQSCRIFCSTVGQSTVRTVGGTITAANDLNISAATSITNIAGSLTGANNATFMAPSITAAQLQDFILLERPSGLTNFFRGRRGWLASSSIGGQFTALNGNLTFDGDLVSAGAGFFAGGDFIVTGEQQILPVENGADLIGRQDLGAFRRLSQ